jgi:hypothetical protein
MGHPQESSKTRNQDGADQRVSALDVEREASMADEGGVSAALLEIEDPKERRALHPGARASRVSKTWIVAGLLGIVVVGGLGWWVGRAVK